MRRKAYIWKREDIERNNTAESLIDYNTSDRGESDAESKFEGVNGMDRSM